MTIWLEHGDMRTVLQRLYAEEAQVDAIVTDPPYELGFMGKKWDNSGIAFQVNTWRLCYDLLPPGGHLLAFSGTRTYHRMAVAIEEAGFEIRDMVAWIYGQGFPKSLDVSKAIDKMAGAEREVVSEGAPVKRMIPGADQNKHGWEKNNGRVYVPTETAPATDLAAQWEGWGTALKPAMEPICVARKPLDGTVAANVLKHGVGALNIDGCRIAANGDDSGSWGNGRRAGGFADIGADKGSSKPNGKKHDAGRWPANVVHDGSDEVVNGFPDVGKSTGGRTANISKTSKIYGGGNGLGQDLTAESVRGDPGFGDSGSASRFFYCAKANAKERMGFDHPTVKPIALLRWLVRMVTPPGGVVLDPFAGTGTMGVAAEAEGFDAILVEREAKYAGFIKERLPATQVTTHDVQP
jgi:hypothetical protein